MCTKNELHIILKLMAKAYRDIYGKNLSQYCYMDHMQEEIAKKIQILTL